jgi:NDP-sugar pyrophosphorylase family protein
VKVLITTSGLGRRLGKFTDFTNKSLVRVGDKPAISLIIEKYPKDTEFVVTTGYKGDHVKQFLSIAYPSRKIDFVDVDPYKGKGSSLGYSISKAEELIQEPFVFNCCDTILTEKDSIPDLSSNWCGVSKKQDASQFRTLQTNNNLVIRINEKGETGYDFAYIGLCGIKDYKLFWESLSGSINNGEGQNLSDVHVINRMIKETPFEIYETKLWLDTGGVEELERTRSYFPSSANILDKDNEAVYIFDDFIMKFFVDEQVNSDRVQRASILGNVCPDVLQASRNFYKYQKVQGTLASELVNESRFSELLDWADKNLWKRSETENFEDKCREFYINKSFKRIDNYLAKNELEENLINEEETPTAKELIKESETKLIDNSIPSRIHGDFILDNIIDTKKGFSLIDWRQDFAGDLRTGDLYYDLAKLNHNLTINHEIINRGLYEHSSNNCHVLCNSTLIRFKSLLHKFIEDKGFNLGKVKILSSIIWINMAPLHEYPFSKFLFNFGKYNLYKELKKDE